MLKAFKKKWTKYPDQPTVIHTKRIILLRHK
jgi:hypothetical protein